MQNIRPHGGQRRSAERSASRVGVQQVQRRATSPARPAGPPVAAHELHRSGCTKRHRSCLSPPTSRFGARPAALTAPGGCCATFSTIRSSRTPRRRRCWSSVTRSAGNRCCAGCVTRCPTTRLALVLTNRAPLEPRTSLALTCHQVTLPSHLILLTDRPDAARPASGRLPHLAGRARRVVVPAVVARPRWLVSGDAGDAAGVETSPPAPRQWAQRRLAFFAGHVPRLFISPLRYLIWKQIRNLPGVTAISHTLDCSIAAYAVCGKPRKQQFAARTVQCAAAQPCTCCSVDKCRLGAFCSAPKPYPSRTGSATPIKGSTSPTSCGMWHATPAFCHPASISPKRWSTASALPRPVTTGASQSDAIAAGVRAAASP